LVYDDLPDIINMCDMREVKQLNEKIMKICKLVIDNLEGQETNTNSLESNENKSHVFPLYLFHFYHSNWLYCFVREFHFCHFGRHIYCYSETFASVTVYYQLSHDFYSHLNR
jgi:hypothetical protein